MRKKGILQIKLTTVRYDSAEWFAMQACTLLQRRAEHFSCRINLQEQIRENWREMIQRGDREKGGADKETEGTRISKRWKEEKAKDKHG